MSKVEPVFINPLNHTITIPIKGKPGRHQSIMPFNSPDSMEGPRKVVGEFYREFAKPVGSLVPFQPEAQVAKVQKKPVAAKVPPLEGPITPQDDPEKEESTPGETKTDESTDTAPAIPSGSIEPPEPKEDATPAAKKQVKAAKKGKKKVAKKAKKKSKKK